jgi:hypothetical protein
MKKNLKGPQGYTIVLNTDDVFNDDPGKGTPALVYDRSGRFSATYWCAMDGGELDGPRSSHTLPDAVVSWLRDSEDTVDAYLYG